MIRWVISVYLLLALPISVHADSMKGMSGPNRIQNGRFEENGEVAYPWTGVDKYGYLRKSVAMRGVHLFVDRSNQFEYAFMGNSASFVDMDGDGLPDIVAPDGAGIFWFWKNLGRRGEPRFGFGEVMPLLVDNERSTYRTIPGIEREDVVLSPVQIREKQRIDARRKSELERMQRQNETRDGESRWSEEDLQDWIEDKLPYPWEINRVSTGNTFCMLNGYRQLRAVAAPCDWDRNGTVDFMVGDAQGNVYDARNLGTRTAPNFRTYSRSRDALLLKLALQYNPVERRNENRAVQFLNYATPYVADWNGNGSPDLLLGEGTYSTNAVRLYLDPQASNPAQGTFPEERVLYVGEERTFLAPSAWDWDGDGFLDLIVADAEGRITIHPNPGGRFSLGNREMEEFVTVKMEEEEPGLRRFTVPQPCDWNADGIMDLIWSGPFGRIFYSIGKEKGGADFGPPTPVRSAAAQQVRKISVPRHVGMAAVPAYRQSRVGKGGTADSRRFFSAWMATLRNKGGWPTEDPWYGLMPGWDPDEAYARYQELTAGKPFNPEKFYRNSLTPSYAIAPVPYEVFELVKEPASRNSGAGQYTLVQSWHDPRTNRVFTQPRDRMTDFGQAVSLHFDMAKMPSIPKNRSSEEKKAWMKDHLHHGNVRVSFYMKLEGDFSKLTVDYTSREFYSSLMKTGDDGHIYFKTLEQLPVGRWFQYEQVVGPSERPRHPGSLIVRLYGRGQVHIRDVAVADTQLPPTPIR